MHQEKTVSTDVVFSENINKDFFYCCSLFADSDNFLINGNINKKQIWSFPFLVNKFILNEANQAIIKLVFDTICSYEKKWTGCGLIFLEIVNNNYKFSVSENMRPSSNFIISAIQKNLKCDITKNIFNFVKRYGNPQLSMSVQRSPIEKPIIKFISTPSVRLRVHPSFLLREDQYKNCRFFMVNGAISKPSEITKLLNKSFETKEEVFFLVCKSFNDEVLYTLKENYDRNITNIIPVEHGFDLDSINSLADLQSIVGGLPFSADLGDILSAADFSRIGNSDYIKINKNSFTIKPFKNNKNHIKKLSKQIQASNQEKRKLLSKRLIALKGNSCNVFLPKHSRFNAAEINIRHASLMMNQMSRYGIRAINIGKKKFYIPDPSCTIIQELRLRIEDLLETKIYLPRR